MNILSIVKSKQQKADRLTAAQQAHLQARAYRGVVVDSSKPQVVFATIEGKRYACTPVD